MNHYELASPCAQAIDLILQGKAIRVKDNIFKRTKVEVFKDGKLFSTENKVNVYPIESFLNGKPSCHTQDYWKAYIPEDLVDFTEVNIDTALSKLEDPKVKKDE